MERPDRTQAATAVLGLALLALQSVPALAQTTWYVDAAGNPPGAGTPADPYTSIRYALERPTTADADVVHVLPGTYAETIDFLGKSVEVRSAAGPAATRIDGGGAGTVVRIASGEASATLRGFTVTGGTGTPVGGVPVGGGVLCAAASHALLVDCRIEGNTALRGGGFCVVQGSLALTDCSVLANHAETGGGGHAESAVLALTGTRFADNVARSFDGPFGSGGGLHAEQTTTSVVACTFEANLAEGTPAPGGGLHLVGGVTSVQSSTIAGNGAGEFSSFGLYAGRGGGIHCASGELHVSDSVLDGNFGAMSGGNVYGIGSFTDCEIRGGYSQFGGGAYATGPQMTLLRCRVRGNNAFSDGTKDFGGGVWGPAQLSECEVTDNLALGDGGGVVGATLRDCLVARNRAFAPDVGQDARGGGAHDATLIDCVVSGNVALGFPPESLPGFGGGLSGGSATRCEVRDNEADVGGGAFASVLDRCTVVRNSAREVTDGAEGCVVTSSILWSNGVEVGAFSTVAWSDVAGGAPGIGNLDVDPAFWRAVDDDFFLRPGSPCIDAGDPSRTDPDGSVADMGAHPYDPDHVLPPVAYCSAKPSSLGCLPFLTTSGTPSLSAAQPFHLDANDVLPDQPGLLLYGFHRADRGFHGGRLCVTTPLRRAGQFDAEDVGGPPCTGRLRIDFNQRIQSGTDPLLTLGRLVTAQWIQRDPADPAGFGDSLSDAVAFYVTP